MILFSLAIVLFLQGTMSVGGKLFVSTGVEDTYANGQALCAKADAALACPQTAAENAAMQAIAKMTGKYAYININDIQSEGKFVYGNGMPVRFTSWKSGEPNNQNNEDCAVVFADALWNDLDCGRKALIICET